MAPGARLCYFFASPEAAMRDLMPAKNNSCICAS
jgi:hypothetical protein